MTWPVGLPCSPADLAVLLARALISSYAVRAGLGLLAGDLLQLRDPAGWVGAQASIAAGEQV